jgi:hypothetical protein
LRGVIRLSPEIGCRFSQALGKPARARKRRPSQSPDKTLFVPIFFEHRFNECFVNLIWRFSHYESQTGYCPNLSGEG